MTNEINAPIPAHQPNAIPELTDDVREFIAGDATQPHIVKEAERMSGAPKIWATVLAGREQLNRMPPCDAKGEAALRLANLGVMPIPAEHAPLPEQRSIQASLIQGTAWKTGTFLFPAAGAPAPEWQQLLQQSADKARVNHPDARERGLKVATIKLMLEDPHFAIAAIDQLHRDEAAKQASR